jgi:4'-phosphopantetheinyl transferase
MNFDPSGPRPQHRLAQGAANIDLWLAYYHEIVDTTLLESMRVLLDDAERDQHQRFHFEDDRKRYLVTRALVRTVLSRYAPVDPADWTFSANAWGRPEIATRHCDAAGLCFNISHTRGLIALAVTRGRALGVDVESLVARPASIGIAERFFAPAEVADLAALAPEQRHDRFYEYWTFKEAYIKARGMGLSLPLERFSFHFPDDRSVRLAIGPELGDDAERWGLWQLRPTPSFLLALCAERLEDQPTLAVRKIIPTAGDELVAAAPLRSSSWRAG